MEKPFLFCLLIIFTCLSACQFEFKSEEASKVPDTSSPAPLEADLDQSWAPHSANLVAYWQVTGNDGDELNHSSSLDAVVGPNAVIRKASPTDSSATVITAPHNKGVTIGNTYIELSGPNQEMDFSNNRDFSFQAWVKWSGNAPWGRIISNGNHGYYNGWVIQVSPSLGCGNTFPGSFYIGLGSDTTSVLSDNAIAVTNQTFNDDQWHHLAAVFEQSTTNKTLTVYVDGVKTPISKVPLTDNGCVPLGETCGTIVDNTLDYTSCPEATSRHAWETTYIGNGRWGQSDLFPGSLSEIAVWSTALTAAEVNLIFNRQK